MTARIKCFFCCIDRHILEFLTHICLGFAWVNQHLYRTKTSSLQIISGLSLIFFGLAFGVGGVELYKLRTYQHFQMLQPWLLMLILLIIGVAQVVLAMFMSPRSNVLSGWLLQWNGLCWLSMCAAYAAGYPLLNPAVLVTALLGFVCILTGRGLIDKNKGW